MDEKLENQEPDNVIATAPLIGEVAVFPFAINVKVKHPRMSETPNPEKDVD